jgi:HEPN domain-containing protein
MAQNADEWLRQADYDMASAEYMFAGGRNFYAVFLCHLAIEKALKGIIQKKIATESPKVHSLSYLKEIAGIIMPGEAQKFLSEISNYGIITRYPETLTKMEESFTADRTQRTLEKGKELLRWLQSEFKKL